MWFADIYLIDLYSNWNREEKKTFIIVPTSKDDETSLQDNFRVLGIYAVLYLTQSF
jgi:hypothetical protein